MAYSWREVDKGWKALRRAMRDAAADASYVKVGVLDDGKGAAQRGTVTNAELAAIHEFGTRDGHIPERSFIRSTFFANRSAYVDLLGKLVLKVIDQKLTIEQALGLVGSKIAADIKLAVTSGAGIPPPNAPSTLRAKLGLTRKGSKGSPRTLVDTGRMIGALTWRVVRASSGK